MDGWILKLFLPDWSSKCRQTDPRKSAKINVRFQERLTCSKESLVRLGFWEAVFGLLFGATFPPACVVYASFSPLVNTWWLRWGGSKKRTTGLVRDHETKRSSRKLLDSSLLNLAGQLRRTNRVGWSWRLAFEISRTKVWTLIWRENFQFRTTLELWQRVMAYGKGKDVILTIPDWDIHSTNDRRSTIGDLSGNCRVPGDLGVWRRDTHAADKMRMQTHTVTHYCFIDVDRRRWRAHQLTYDLKRCLLFRKCLRFFESESSFGAFVCHRRPGGSMATSHLVYQHSMCISNCLLCWFFVFCFCLTRRRALLTVRSFWDLRTTCAWEAAAPRVHLPAANSSFGGPPECNGGPAGGTLCLKVVGFYCPARL